MPNTRNSNAMPAVDWARENDIGSAAEPRAASRHSGSSSPPGAASCLALAYFGTDQSQVQRYLSGRSVTESRLGLLFNGLFKIPMQFVILLLGVLVFVFYLFAPPPIFFNTAALAAVERSAHGDELHALQARYDDALAAQRQAAHATVTEAIGFQRHIPAPLLLIQAAQEQVHLLMQLLVRVSGACWQLSQPQACTSEIGMGVSAKQG